MYTQDCCRIYLWCSGGTGMLWTLEKSLILQHYYSIIKKVLWLEIDSKGIFHSILATSLFHPQLGSLPSSLAASSEELFSEMCWWVDLTNATQTDIQVEQRRAWTQQFVGTVSQRIRTTHAGLEGLWAWSGNWMMCMKGGNRIVYPNHTGSSSFLESNFLVFPFFSHLCWAQDFHCTYNSGIEGSY